MRSFLKSKIYLETNGPSAMTLRSAELFASREPGCLELWARRPVPQDAPSCDLYRFLRS